jgi:GT2 family glycosyltransferase
MKRAIQKGYRFVKDIEEFFHYGWSASLLSSYSKSFIKLLTHHLNLFRHTLYTKKNYVKHINEEKVHKLKRVTDGLHSLLSADNRFSYSVLMVVKQARLPFLKKALQAVLNQSAPHIEFLIGFEGEQSSQIYQLVEEYQKKSPKTIRTFQLTKENEKKNFSINELAKEAKGNFIFLMDQHDWIRPDLLFRYEQTLRIFEDPEQVALICQDNKINELDYSIPLSETIRTAFHFPFLFESIRSHGLLVARSLWEKVGGLRFDYKGCEYEDLLLRLDLEGANYEIIPISLYSKRIFSNTKEDIKPRSLFLKTLNEYTQTKKLDWEWTTGYDSHHVRAVPPLQHPHSVQVIVPFKDQKKLTLSCIQHVLKQKEISFKITAIDNASQDKSIGEELLALGIEVLLIDEPFNYSRLNNLAVQRTQTALECDLILFLNNDVDLEEDALLEMVRWIDQPQIGMVGCRLHYPNGLLQHGGVYLDYYQIPHQKHWEMQWSHIEKMATFEQMNQSKKLGVVHAVTAACALIKRKTFLEVGGFDEVWYPIAYSDTNLAVKLSLLGLKCFYTPYAVGVHHESVSRKEGIEDYENSRWLHQLLLKHRHRIPHFFH